MSPTFSALLLLIVLEKAGSVQRAVVTFHPNWDKIFTTESVTMTCNVRPPIPADVSYTWYKDNIRISRGQNFTISNAQLGNSGSYQCDSTRTERSDPVRLDAIYDYVILQVPLYIHEGDDVSLRCHHYPGYQTRFTIFYKDTTLIRNWENDDVLRIRDIRLGGSYRCTKEVSFPLGYYLYSGGGSVSVIELFTLPEIKVTPVPVTEGDVVTVRCHSSISLYRPDTQLQFAFYRDGLRVQEFSSSDQYGVQSAQMEDSGNYHCDARTTVGNRIVKRSREVNVKINVFFTHPEILMTPNPMTEGDNMTLTCHTTRSLPSPDLGLRFAFYRDGQNIQTFEVSHQYGVESAQLRHSGNYSCDVRASTNNLTKSSEVVSFQIQELFSQPTIEMFQDEVTEGNQMTLSCNTSVLGTAEKMELQFAFFKNDEKVQEFNPSHQYEVQSAQLEDSGNYSCEVKTSTNSVRKRSDEINVDIQGSSNPDLLTYLLLALGLLVFIITILVAFFIFRKFRSSAQPQEPPTEALVASSNESVEPEITYSVLAMHPMSQNVPATTSEDSENKVVYSAVKSRRKAAADPESIYQNM